MVSKLKLCQSFLKFCTLANLKVRKRSLEIIKNFRFTTRIEFFLISFLAKDLFWNVLQGFKYANKYGCKIFTKWLGSEVIEIKECIDTEKFMPCLYIHDFISFSVWFFRHEDNFYNFLPYILSFILQVLPLSRRKCCVF